MREVERLNQKLKEDPNFTLTEKEENLLQRAKNYESQKAKLERDNNTTNWNTTENDEL